jgi:hypothetical protein
MKRKGVKARQDADVHGRQRLPARWYLKHQEMPAWVESPAGWTRRRLPSESLGSRIAHEARSGAAPPACTFGLSQRSGGSWEAKRCVDPGQIRTVDQVLQWEREDERSDTAPLAALHTAQLPLPWALESEFRSVLAADMKRTLLAIAATPEQREQSGRRR